MDRATLATAVKIRCIPDASAPSNHKYSPTARGCTVQIGMDSFRTCQSAYRGTNRSGRTPGLCQPLVAMAAFREIWRDSGDHSERRTSRRPPPRRSTQGSRCVRSVMARPNAPPRVGWPSRLEAVLNSSRYHSGKRPMPLAEVSYGRLVDRNCFPERD